MSCSIVQPRLIQQYFRQVPHVQGSLEQAMAGGVLHWVAEGHGDTLLGLHHHPVSTGGDSKCDV